MEFSTQEYWSGMPFPSPVGLPNPGMEPRSPALQVDSLLSEPPEMPLRAQFLWVSSLSISNSLPPSRLVQSPPPSLKHLPRNTSHCATQPPFSNTDLLIQPLLSCSSAATLVWAPSTLHPFWAMAQPPSLASHLFLTRSQKNYQWVSTASWNMKLACSSEYFPMWSLSASVSKTYYSFGKTYLLVLARGPTHTFYLWPCFSSAWKSSSSLHTTVRSLWIKWRGLSWSHPPFFISWHSHCFVTCLFLELSKSLRTSYSCCDALQQAAQW